MSYILDSLKKSDKERRSIDTPTAMVMSAPAFLANESPKKNYRLLIIALIMTVLLLAIYFTVSSSNNFFENSFVRSLSDSSASVSNTPVVDAVLSKEKEEAIQLYKQAVSTKSQPEIDSLYKELNEKKSIEMPLASVSSQEIAENREMVNSQDGNARDVVASEPVPEIASTSDFSQLPDIASVPNETVETKEPKILSIYELDAYVRKNIPSVDYGAHIYATDNNSGFVILDGARRKVGDQLDSGLYIEKIEEESVVLSFNGTLFSLPAMKSWEGK